MFFSESVLFLTFVILVILVLFLYVFQKHISDLTAKEEHFEFEQRYLKKSKLVFFPILDISQIYTNNVQLFYKFGKTKHKFTKNGYYSGNKKTVPIFGTLQCCVKQNDGGMQERIIQKSKTRFGLPFLRVRENQYYETVMYNASDYIVNMHYHGLNYSPSNDGTSDVELFGKNTKIGKIHTLKATMTNNSAFCWYHPHPAFVSSPYIYMGMFGLFEIINAEMEKIFQVNDNYLPLAMGDLDLDKNGTLDKKFLYEKNWLGDYTMINGVVCCSWKKEKNDGYILAHISSKNLVKVSILNGSCSFRRYKIGFCDILGNIKHFHLVQSDCGYTSPSPCYMSFLSPAERKSFIIDLADYKDRVAVMFLYDIEFSDKNQIKKFETSLCQLPLHDSKFLKKPILFIRQEGTEFTQDIKKDPVFNTIKKIVFGSSIIESSNNKNLNVPLPYYLSLNHNFFYNLPQFNSEVQERNFVFFEEAMETAEKNQNSEFCMGAQRIFVDMWFRDKVTGRPTFPSCLFTISKYKNGILKYINYQIEDNHLLEIEILEAKTNKQIQKAILSFPEIEQPKNIQEWVALVNDLYSTVKVGSTNLNDLVQIDWKFDVFEVVNDSLGKKKVNTVYLEHTNNSNFKIILKAKWNLLSLLGKPFSAMVPEKMGLSTKDIPKMKGNLQQIFPLAGSMKGMPVLPNQKNQFDLVLHPFTKYRGYIDGFLNNCLFNFSINQGTSEKYIYTNLAKDVHFSHPFHFHMTSGFKTGLNAPSTKKIQCFEPIYGEQLNYSKDTYSIFPGDSVEFNVKYPYKNSLLGPNRYLGYVYHCHYMNHHDMSMMGQFYVFPKKNT